MGAPLLLGLCRPRYEMVEDKARGRKRTGQDRTGQDRTGGLIGIWRCASVQSSFEGLLPLDVFSR